MHMNRPKFFGTSDVCKAKHLLGTSSNPIQTSSSPIQTRARLSIGFKATISPSLAFWLLVQRKLGIDYRYNLKFNY